MSNSIVSICNLSLGWVAANRIISLEDDSIEAQLCRENYDSCRRAVLEETAWAFASARTNLPPSAEAVAWGYATKFLLPADCLKVYWANDNPLNEEWVTNTLRWKREGNFILADTNNLYIRFTRDETDPTLFSPTFVHALAGRMAADFAIPLTHSRKLQKDMWAIYLAKIELATSSDAQQGRNEQMRPRTLTNRR